MTDSIKTVDFPSINIAAKSLQLSRNQDNSIVLFTMNSLGEMNIFIHTNYYHTISKYFEKEKKDKL